MTTHTSNHSVLHSIAKPITNDADHERALARIETLFDAKPGTPEGDELDRLVTLVEAYEQDRFPIVTSSTPVSQKFAPA